MIFIDSNIPMYVAGRQHPNKEPSRRFLDRVREEQLEACTSSEVLQELLYRYHAIKRPDLAFKVYDLFVQICPTVLPVSLADTDKAKSLLEQICGLSVRDAVHGAVMINNGIEQIATFDQDFDGLPGVSRYPI
jgi:predicted nucleic acid-binding protein